MSVWGYKSDHIAAVVVIWSFVTMRALLVAVVSFLALGSLQAEEGKHWALLVAGSNSWYNYRHQADVCHAYQILHKHGIPDENIVVMMYDDLANNRENPTPGVIINHEGGPNVYEGVLKDYTGKDVTPENFLNILQGNAEAMAGIGSGKVIRSGPNDHVFVNFVDHGAPGILGFPTTMLHAKDLNAAIKRMHDNNSYKQMVFYIEACESGSIFEGLLPTDWNIYATTAANAKESSYACYMDKLRNTYLGDVYSVKWMEDSDKEDLSVETLFKQFKVVKRETNTSHVQEYGDKTVSREDVADFQGGAKATPQVLPSVPLDAVASEDVPMAILHHKLSVASTPEEAAVIRKELDEREQAHLDIERSMRSIVALAAASPDDVDRLLYERRHLTQHDCYIKAVETYTENCFDVNKYDYALRHFYALVNLCEDGRPSELIVQSVSSVCQMKLY